MMVETEQEKAERELAEKLNEEAAERIKMIRRING